MASSPLRDSSAARRRTPSGVQRSLSGSDIEHAAASASDGPPAPPQLCQLCNAVTALWHCTNCRIDQMFYCGPCRDSAHSRVVNASDHNFVAVGSEGGDAGTGGAAAASTDDGAQPPTASTSSAPATSAASPGGASRSIAAMSASERLRASEAAQQADYEASQRIVLPFSPGADDSQPLPLDAAPDELWRFGDPLVTAYLSWNLAMEQPPPEDELAALVKPCAHLLCVATQENGPYVGSSKMQDEWSELVLRTLHSPVHYERAPSSARGHVRRAQMKSKAGGAPTPPDIEKTRSVAVQRSRAQYGAAASGTFAGSNSAVASENGGPSPILPATTPHGTHEAPSFATESSTAAQPPRARRRWRYRVVAQQGMMATHVMVLAREDVFRHVSMEHAAAEKTGWVGGTFGNKGGVGIGFAVCRAVVRPGETISVLEAKPGDPDRARTEDALPGAASPTAKNRTSEDATPPPEEASRPDGTSHDPAPGPPSLSVGGIRHSPREGGRDERGEQHSRVLVSKAPVDDRARDIVTFLFIGAHLAPHQSDVERRNADYRNIVSNLRVGKLGPYPQIVRRAVTGKGGAGGGGGADAPATGAGKLPGVAAAPGTAAAQPPAAQDRPERDCTEEFDVCVFGGDLNYRINGTKFGIENIIRNHREIRAALANNDQLIREKLKGRVFHGFEEGPLSFRPTYKFDKDKATGRYVDTYDTGPKMRFPAYCDRALYKRHAQYPCAVQRLLYTDVPDVRTSDHRPVACLLSVGTVEPNDDADAPEIPDATATEAACCGCGCAVM